MKTIADYIQHVIKEEGGDGGEAPTNTISGGSIATLTPPLGTKIAKRPALDTDGQGKQIKEQEGGHVPEDENDNLASNAGKFPLTGVGAQDDVAPVTTDAEKQVDKTRFAQKQNYQNDQMISYD